MWLLPVLSQVARLALHGFYRMRVAGGPVARSGPLLLFANHPNSLLDPAMVAAFAGRPVRFLAKAPLFSDPLVGWLVRGAGAIPVYRKMEGEALMARNEDTFRAAEDALATGSAVGIFPEGLSHSDPAIHPLKTGTARIALATATRTGRVFPLVPMGISLRDKQSFRSEALVLIGEAVQWDDLAASGSDDPGAVRQLTTRMEEALRAVTVNLESWHDAPLVESALDIWSAERGGELDSAFRVEALREVSDGLARLRQGGGSDWAALAGEVERHGRVLRSLGLSPLTLVQPSRREAIGWTARQLTYFAVAAPAALLGVAALYLPYRATGWVVERAAPEPDTEATYKLLIGAGLMLLTLLAWGGLAWHWKGPVAAGVAVAVLPLLGLAALRARDRWHAAWGAVRRYRTRSRRVDLVAELRSRQRELASRLAELREVASA